MVHQALGTAVYAGGDPSADPMHLAYTLLDETRGELLSTARTFRASSAPGPDGVSGGLVKSGACHFPHLTSAILWKQFLLLSDSADPLVAATVTDATPRWVGDGSGTAIPDGAVGTRRRGVTEA